MFITMSTQKYYYHCLPYISFSILFFLVKISGVDTQREREREEKTKGITFFRFVANSSNSNVAYIGGSLFSSSE